MRTEITCSMLESTSTSDNDEMNTYVYRLPCLKPEINYLMKETRLFDRSLCKLVKRGKNIRAKIPLMEKFTLNAMRCRSMYNTIKKIDRRNC